ncbi:MAG: peptidoglycan-associated lipoprotein Pal [Syntrophaceae bacterium]|nr:peptidoglycan-associated lipoprotein Pal [Syntrophaceae bacterium]
MKIYINLRGIFVVLILGILIFTGCAEKKAVVTSDAGPGQEMASTATTDQQSAMASEETPTQDTSTEKSVDLEKMARMRSPVSDINFDFDSSSIRPDAREILRTNANYFMRHRISSIIIEGHCDERGTAEYNMALGERRAQETKKYLINLGIKESIMRTVSFGEENPFDPASNEEAWAKNRRSHFAVNP